MLKTINFRSSVICCLLIVVALVISSFLIVTRLTNSNNDSHVKNDIVTPSWSPSSSSSSSAYSVYNNSNNYYNKSIVDDTFTDQGEEKTSGNTDVMEMTNSQHVTTSLQQSKNSNVVPGYFADNGFANVFSSITHPTGEYYNGVTYITYQGPHEDAYVVSYDHTAKKYTGPIKVIVNPMGLYPETPKLGDTDNHGRPTLVVSQEDGYINIFLGGHGGCPKVFGIPNNYGEGCKIRPNGNVGRTIHARSKKPNSIKDGFDIIPLSQSGLSPFSTYLSTIKMDNGHIYLFYRHGPHTGNWVYQKSTNGGKTFEMVQSFLKYDYVGKSTRNNIQIKIFDTWYVTCFRDGPTGIGQANTNTIGCQFVYHYHAVGDGNDGPVRYNGYYMELDTATDTWYTLLPTTDADDTIDAAENDDGGGAPPPPPTTTTTTKRRIDTPLTKEIADKYAMFYNSTVKDFYSSVYKGSDWRYHVLTGTFNKFDEPCLIFRRTPPNSMSMNIINNQLHYWRYSSQIQKWLGPYDITKMQNEENDDDEDLRSTINKEEDGTTAANTATTTVVVNTKSIYFDTTTTTVDSNRSQRQRKTPRVIMSYNIIKGEVDDNPKGDGSSSSSSSSTTFVGVMKGTEGGTNWDIQRQTKSDMLQISNVKVAGRVLIGEIRNAHPDIKTIVAVRYGDIHLYSRLYLVGDNGIIPRSRNANEPVDDLWKQCYEAQKPKDCF